MLAHPENNNINIHIYYQETLLKFMSAVWLFIIRTLTMVYLEVISKIQSYIGIMTIIYSYGWNANKYSSFWFTGCS